MWSKEDLEIENVKKLSRSAGLFHATPFYTVAIVIDNGLCLPLAFVLALERVL